MAGAVNTLPSETSAYPLKNSISAATYLGYSKSTFRRRVVEAGVVPYLKDRQTGRRRYRQEDLDTYLRQVYDYTQPEKQVSPDGRTAMSVKRRNALLRN